MENVDKLYVLLKAKESGKIKNIDLTEYQSIDIKSLEEFVNEKQMLEKTKSFENLSDLINGNGIEVDIPEDSKNKSSDELLNSILEENQIENEESKEEKVVDKEQEALNGKKNIIVIPVKDEEDKNINLVFEITTDENGVTTLKDIGEIKQDEFIISEEYRNEIIDKLEKTGVTGTIDAKVIEREFIPKTAENLNEMNQEGELDLEDNKEIAERAILAQEKGILERDDNNISELDEPEPEETELSGEDKSVAEKACEITGRSMGTIKRVLTIQDPKSATDTLNNDGLNENGEPITVLEFRGTAGKEEYCLVQGNRILDQRYYDEDINKLVLPIRQTTRVVRKVSDEETKKTISSIDGKEEKVKIQRMPSDIDQTQKQEMIYEIDAIMDKINQIKEMDIKQFEKPEDKYNAIDSLQNELLGVFQKYGVEAPNIVREEAKEKVTPEEVGDEGEGWERKSPWEKGPWGNPNN